jgi:hypothetical protein
MNVGKIGQSGPIRVLEQLSRLRRLVVGSRDLSVHLPA